MWWIDRWRQSDAYARMTAEEQGLYRNLCDEVFLRESGVIPDDNRILAKASGDHEAWARSGASVLRSMQRVEGGWTNKTAMEVKAESERRSQKQRSYRRSSGNEPGNGVGNEPGNETRPPDMEQDKEQGNGNGSIPDIAAIDRLDEDLAFEEIRFRDLALPIRDRIQSVLDSLPRSKERSPFSASRWLRTGQTGVPRSEGGLTVLRLTCDALEAWKRSQDAPIISDSNRQTLDAIKRAGDRLRAKHAGQAVKEITG